MLVIEKKNKKKGPPNKFAAPIPGVLIFSVEKKGEKEKNKDKQLKGYVEQYYPLL